MGSTITNNNDVQASLITRVWCWLKGLPEKFIAKVVGVATMARNIARDDPRKVIHSLKVALAITLVSLLYYFQPLYDSFGVSAMWAVMTVVVVLEFTVGATLGKGFNRATATLLAGGLGVGAHHLASLSGKIGEPVLLGSFVFLLAATSTFMRFFPKIKARYDYGFLIFILTFSFVSISGFRTSEIIELAHKRLSTIVLGGFVSLIINVFIFPVWAGAELHNSVSLNMEKLANFLEGFGTAYFKTSDVEANSKDGSCKLLLQGYKSVLNSKSMEENLANFARWEPGHGHYRFCHPWREYLKLGTLIRQCAYRIDALNAYIKPDIQGSQKLRGEIREVCIKMSVESSKALKELGASLRKMKQPSFSVDTHIMNSKAAVKTLKCLLKSGSLWEGSDLLEVIPVATVASLLVDVVDCVDKIAASTHDLASFAHFKKVEDPNVSPEKSKANNNINRIEVINQGTNVHNHEVVNIIALAELISVTSAHVEPNFEGQLNVD